MVESQQPSSFFAEPSWEPLCLVGSHDGGRRNAQVAVCVFGASIVPDRQRLLVVLWNANYTASLVARSGTLAITLLSAAQLPLLRRLGLESGRERDKLAGVDYHLTRAGDPWVEGGAGWLAAEVIDSVDLGDATLFICAVREEHRDPATPPITWREAQELVGEEFLRDYRAKFDRDAAAARPRMRWPG